MRHLPRLELTSGEAANVYNESALQVNFVDSELDLFALDVLEETGVVNLTSLLGVEVCLVKNYTAEVSCVDFVHELFVGPDSYDFACG